MESYNDKLRRELLNAELIDSVLEGQVLLDDWREVTGLRRRAACNGCAERFTRTLKEQCIWSRAWRDVDELAEGRTGVRRALQHLSGSSSATRHRTPREAYLAATAGVAA